VIKGHKHLRDCAYIGDNSSEEEDEIMMEGATPDEKVEAKSLPKHLHRKLNNSTSSDSSTASPRRREGIIQ